MADDIYGDTVTLATWDIVVIVLYFVIVMAVGIFATIRADRSSAKGFFIADKSMTFIPIAGSIYASNIGAPMFVGLAGSSASFGFAPVMFEWHATYCLILLGWIFVPIYIASGSYTMPEYLQKRFGRKRLRILYSIVLLAMSIVSGISGEIYAGSLFMQQLLGWDIYLSTVLILLITAIYTIGGLVAFNDEKIVNQLTLSGSEPMDVCTFRGLAAVIYTDTLQAFILIAGSMAVSIIAMDKIGGYESMVNQFLGSASRQTYLYQSISGNASCGFPPSDSFHIFRGMNSNYPWPGLVFGLTLLATYYWCTQQVIVQRNLAAKDISHSKAACVIASYLKILPFFLFTWPGMSSRILYPDEVACSTPESCNKECGNPAGCTNIAYPLLVLRLLPEGLRGLMLAAMLAALMSSLTSQYNSSSSLFTLDIWLYFRRKASEFEVVLVGRLFGLVLIGLSIAWLPILQAVQGGQLWDYLQSISSYITPPWVVAFVLGCFWPRLSEQATWWGLLIGLATGFVRMGVEFAYAAPKCGSGDPDERPDIIKNVHYLMFAIILAAVCFVVMVALSIVTPPRKKKQLRRVTWWTRHDIKFPDLTESSSSSSSDEEQSIKSEKSVKEVTCLRKTYNFMCGASPVKQKLSKEEKLQLQLAMTDIKENKFWSRVCDVNAIIAIGLTCFIIGFYA